MAAWENTNKNPITQWCASVCHNLQNCCLSAKQPNKILSLSLIKRDNTCMYIDPFQKWRHVIWFHELEDKHQNIYLPRTMLHKFVYFLLILSLIVYQEASGLLRKQNIALSIAELYCQYSSNLFVFVLIWVAVITVDLFLFHLKSTAGNIIPL